MPADPVPAGATDPTEATKALIEWGKLLAAVVAGAIGVLVAVVKIIPARITALSEAKHRDREDDRTDEDRAKAERDEARREALHNEQQAMRLWYAYTRLASICEGQGWKAGTRPDPVEFTPYQSAPPPGPAPPAEKPPPP